MNKLAYKNIVEGNWQEVKGTLQTKWAKLTDDDLEKIDGSYKKLVGKLQKLYGYELTEIEEEISEFFDASQFEKMKQQAIKKILEIKDVVTSVIDEYFQATKKKTYDIEKAGVDFVRKNPIKAMGFSAAIGFLVSYIYKHKK